MSAYPAATLPGLGLTRFAKEVRVLSGDDSCVECVFEASMDAAAILKSVSSGESEIGDLYCGALSGIDALFQLGSLPFQSATTSVALQFLAAARPHYEQRFAELGVRLLYVTPWPATGLWTRVPVRSKHDFEQMRIRTYDRMSADVVRRVGGRAVEMPIGQLFEELHECRLEGVLSSGDGVAGQKLAKHLHFFYDIGYANPVSFAVMNHEIYRNLAREQRKVVDQAAAKVERELWRDLPLRIQENRGLMHAAGIQVFTELDPSLRNALLEAGRSVSNQWELDVSLEVASFLGGFHPSPQGR
jgi:TRAP-type C4-dicarboxylate transport system substrate-binding protein